MKKLILALSAAAALAAPSFAEDRNEFGYISLSQIQAMPSDRLAVPVPVQMFDKSANAGPAFDISLMLPFSAMNRKLAGLAGTAMEAVDPTRQILSRQSDLVVLENMQFTIDGVEIVPVVQLKPWFEGVNKLALKVVSLEADISFGPDRAKKSAPAVDKNELMAQAFDKLTSAILAAMDKALAKKKIALRADEILSFKYDKPSWTLHIAINPAFIAPLMPGIVQKINLTHFSLSNEGFTLSMQSGSAADLSTQPGYNLALSDGLITAFASGYTAGTDFDLLPAGRDGGIKFRGDGVTEIAGKIYARDFFLKPNVYFNAKMTMTVTAANTITLNVDRLDLDKAYGIGVPGFLNNWLQKKLVSTVVDTITTNAQLAKVMTAKKLSGSKIQLTLKDAALLPSFAQGMKVTKMKVKHGVMFLAFEL